MSDPYMEDFSDEDEPETLNFKAIVIGDGAVGKTSIIHRFTRDDFKQTYKQTLGLDFFSRKVILPERIHVNLNIWDIGGQQLGSNMLDKYIHGSHCVILTYDVTNYQSFRNLEDWLFLVRQTFRNSEMPLLVLIGNKMDLIHQRTVKLEKHTQFALENEMKSFLMSAKSGDQVDVSFFRIAAELAGIPLTNPEIEVQKKVVQAQIVDYPSTDPGENTTDKHKKKKKKPCTIQ